MGLPASAAGHAAAAAEGGRLRARCRVQTGRQWPSPGRPQAARESGARSNCCTRRGHDDCATATGWPGGRRPIAPLAVPLARPYRAVRPCRSAGTLSVRVTPNRCSLAPRAPMHACMPGCARVADAERAARRTNGPAASAGAGVLPGRLGITMAEVGGPCPLGIGTQCGCPPSCLARPAGARREERAVVDCAAPRTLCANSQLPHRSVHSLRLPAATACDASRRHEPAGSPPPICRVRRVGDAASAGGADAQADLCMVGACRGHTPHSVLRAQIIP